MSIHENALYGHIGHRIKEIRKSLGLTQSDLAKKAGIRRTSMTNIEAGIQKLPLHVIYRICEALDIKDINEILPTIEHAKYIKEVDEVQFNGELNNLPGKTASFVLEILESPQEQSHE